MADQPASTLSLKLDEGMISKMVEGHVSAAIASHLQANGVDIAGRMVNECLAVRVSSDGKIVRRSDYNFNQSKPWFDYEIEKTIREMAQQVLQGWLLKQRPAIEKAFATAYDRRRPQILKAMGDGTMKALERNWNFRFNVDLSRGDDELSA